jgi:two-component system chemotaxis response regulator CheY
MPHMILLAESHEGLRRRIRSTLEAAGFEVCGEATNGLEAIEKARALQPDLIVMEIWMSVMNGLEAIPEIAKSVPRAKILVFTTDDVEELRREALRLGAHSFVCKSNPERLINEVTKLLGGSESGKK